MPEWTESSPLRVVTGYHNIARRFFKDNGFEHVVLLSADGALEAAPLMGTADIILDLVCPFLIMEALSNFADPNVAGCVASPDESNMY